ncbi:MAG TPA: hypothetical protein VN892_05200 [Solirubrobacteraceae bacterium]|nr:hypothetical protein [Solirubrobacteraceae bacterium]
MASPGSAAPHPASAAVARGPRAWWQGLPRRRRIQLRVLLAVVALLILLIGALLARWLQTQNVERDDELALIQAEARGDVTGMLVRLDGCRRSSSCVEGVRRNAADPRLRRVGAVKILSVISPTENALSSSSGKTRLAWTVLGKLPVVQCIEVHRSGNFFSGMSVTLLSLSAPIANEANCTKPSTIETEEEEATEVEER